MVELESNQPNSLAIFNRKKNIIENKGGGEWNEVEYIDSFERKMEWKIFVVAIFIYCHVYEFSTKPLNEGSI